MKMNLFKYYLGHILGNYEEEKSRQELCPLSLHRQQFRNLIGEILMQPADLGSPGPYIPLFYQIQPLIHATKQLQGVHHIIFVFFTLYKILLFFPPS